MQKLEIDHFDQEYLECLFKKNFLGKVPTVLIFLNSEEKKFEYQAKQCLKALESLDIDPYFPYPIYLIAPPSQEALGFPTAKSFESLPPHFVKKIKRLKNREQALLNKAMTLSERIQNHPVHADLQLIRDRAQENRWLRDLCFERQWYKSLLSDLMKHDED